MRREPEAQICMAEAPVEVEIVKKRQLGLDAGRISIAEDFDAPMPELEALFYDEDPGRSPSSN